MKRLLAGLVAAALLTTGPAAARRPAPDAAGGTAPDLSYSWPQGGVQRLSEAPGLVHFVFVARWAPPSEEEVNALRRLAAQVQRRGSYQVVLIGVAQRQTGDDFAEWTRGVGFDGPRIYDADGRLERAFGVETLPWHVVVGRGRAILASGERAPDRATIERWLAAK